MPESADGFEITTPVGETPSQLRRERTTDDPFRLDRSGSHFSPRRTEASSSRGNFGSYRPRQTISTASLRDRGRAFSRNASNSGWAGPLGRSLSQTRQPASTNWQSLQDLVDEPEEAEDDDITIHGHPTESRQSGLDSHSSYKSLGSFFPVPPASRSRALDIRRTGTEDEGVYASISGVFSTSPPSIDNPSSVLGPPSTFLERTNEDIGERLATEHPEIGVKDPLLETRSPQRYESTPIIGNALRKYWPPSPVAIAIFKCAVSYLVASLFTFVPALAGLLSTTSEIDAHGRVTPKPAYSAHMVATIVVYVCPTFLPIIRAELMRQFNPAKTAGHMFLANRFCVVLALLAAAVSICAMLTLAVFDHFSPSQGTRWDLISEIGDWFVCVVWIGGSMALLAWSKVWVNNPSFNSGCSMAAVTIYTVVIKEGAVPKLLEVLLIVLIGAVITNLVCYLIFPMSATTRLEGSISRSLQSFSTLLDLLTSTFLLKKNVIKDTHLSLQSAVKAHAAAFKTLKTDLAEAKNERLIDGRVRGRKMELYDAAVGSLTRLAQHLASLRGGTRLQEGLIRASKEGQIQLEVDENGLGASGGRFGPDLSVSVLRGPMSPGPGLDEDLDIGSSLRLFLRFRDIAGAEMDSLVDKCDDALEAVQSVSRRSDQVDIDVADIRNKLAASLRNFSKRSSIAIKLLYAGPKRAKGIYEDYDSSDDEPTIRRGVEDDSTDGPNETVFLIYFFLFTLEEFARELLFLLDTFAEILSAERTSTLDYILSIWAMRRGKRGDRVGYLYKQFLPVDPSQLQPPLFPKKARDGRSSLVNNEPGSGGLLGKLQKRSWKFGEWLRQPQVRYALKTGIGGAILASPAFTEVGRPIFLEYRGEWALIAYFGAISPTVGQTNFLSFFRVVGTIVGAAVAVLFYTLFPGNPIVLPILGVIFSVPCFYIITQMPSYAQAGRFTLLTYNLTCLYAYNSRERELSALLIAYHRSTSVITGVIWAAVVSRYWWPFTARRELRMGISDFCLDLSYLYSKLVTTYSHGIHRPEREPEPPVSAEEAENEPLLPTKSAKQPDLSASVRQFMSMELHLQSQLGSLRDLLAQTRNEPRLKGPFAFDFYQEVLLSCERMVDRLHSMRCVTTRDEWDDDIRKAFVSPVNKESREMAGNVILYFYTLSAGFRLRTPMPPYLPPAEEARGALVEAIRRLDVVKKRSVRGGGRHLLFFAYALAMQEVVAEMEYVGALMQDAFGVISQSTVLDFEALFEVQPDQRSAAGLERAAA